MAKAEVSVREDAGAGRFEAWIDGERAGSLSYTVAGGEMIVPHTEVDSSFGGLGVGSALAAAALEAARARGLSVVPRCSFMRGYVDRHPEYADLVS